MGKYRNLAVNTLLFAANAVATKLVTFILVPLYTAYLTAGEYGLTDMSLTVINLLTPLVTLDIAEATVRYIVKDKSREDFYVAVGLGVTFASVVIVAALSPMLDFEAFGGLGEFKVWFVAAYAASAVMSVCGETARGRGEVRLIPICAAASSVITLVFAVLLIAIADFGVVGYFASVILGPMVGSAIYLTIGGIGASAIKGAGEIIASGKKVTSELLGPMLKYALPLIPNQLFWWLSTGINRLFITGMLGISASGMFAAASKVPNLLNVAYSVFQQAWQLSAYQESQQEGLEDFFSKIFSLVQAGMTSLCALISFLSPLIATVLLQGETRGSWTMIAPLLLSNLFNVFSAFYGTVYSATMHTRSIMATTVLGALSCIVFTPALLPLMGTYGACVASALGQGLVFFSRAIHSRRYLKFRIGWLYLSPTLILLVLQAIAVAAQPWLWQWISLVCLIGVFGIQGAKVHGELGAVGGLRGALKRIHRNGC